MNQNNRNSQINQSNQNTQSSQSSQRFQTSPTSFLPQHGHYRHLRVYQVTEIIYDITYYFTHHFLSRGDRTVDQMVQAARSGKQNIAEGNQAAATSSETEIKLTNVAKASLQELIEDFEDYLKTRGHRQWEEHSVELEAMRRLGQTHNDANFFMQIAQTRPPETIANMCIVLIKQADYLLYRQLKRLEKDFLEHGGFSEKMARLRNNRRSGKS